MGSYGRYISDFRVRSILSFIMVVLVVHEQWNKVHFFPTSLTDFIGFFLLFLDGVDFNWGEVKPCCDFYLYLSDGIFFRVSVGHLFILLSDSFALQKRLGEISLVSFVFMS